MRKNSSLPSDWDCILSTNKLCYLLGYKTTHVKIIANNFKKFYYENPKKIKEKIRNFECTRGDFKIIQEKIHKILSIYPFPKYMLGIARGKSINDNANVHLGGKTLVTIDIKNCFPNTSDQKVFDMFRNQLGYSPKVSSLLTRLTTYNHHVPQGTPCSSVVVALCLLPLCFDVNKLCQENGLEFSIWVDDITMSGNKVECYIQRVINLFKKHGYACRAKKIKVQRGGNKIKNITGIGIKNNRLTVSKDRVEECMKIIISLANNPNKNYHQKIRSLKGKISFIQNLDRKKSNKIKSFATKLGIKL